MVVQSDKKRAVELRRKGFSYSEIKKFLFIPKSTLSYWLKKIKLSEPQLRRLKRKRSEAGKAGSKFKKLKTLETIEKIQRVSAAEIQKISKRELWLMGVVLYWRDRNKNDLRKGVRFTSSNPSLIKLFLKWLREIGQLKREEIQFDIFLSKRKKSMNRVIDYWSGITGFSKDNFPRIYFQSGKTEFGLLRVRVKASSMLARQISGWINGVQKYLWV